MVCYAMLSSVGGRLGAAAPRSSGQPKQVAAWHMQPAAPKQLCAWALDSSEKIRS